MCAESESKAKHRAWSYDASAAAFDRHPLKCLSYRRCHGKQKSAMNERKIEGVSVGCCKIVCAAKRTCSYQPIGCGDVIRPRPAHRGPWLNSRPRRMTTKPARAEQWLCSIESFKFQPNHSTWVWVGLNRSRLALIQASIHADSEQFKQFLTAVG